VHAIGTKLVRARTSMVSGQCCFIHGRVQLYKKSVSLLAPCAYHSTRIAECRHCKGYMFEVTTTEQCFIRYQANLSVGTNLPDSPVS
jgi:hypothetical protein